jgi:hypothetical protein
MVGFIVFLIVVVVLFLIIRQIRRKKSTEELKNGAGYAVAVKIKDELSKKGFKINDLSVDFDFTGGSTSGDFRVYPDSSSYTSCGSIFFGVSRIAMMSAEYSIRMQNTMERYNNHYYVIENANIGLLVSSSEKSQTVPLFIKIAAEVIKNSEYAFEHPNWLGEDPKAKEYLNVMF